MRLQIDTNYSRSLILSSCHLPLLLLKLGQIIRLLSNCNSIKSSTEEYPERQPWTTLSGTILAAMFYSICPLVSLSTMFGSFSSSPSLCTQQYLHNHIGTGVCVCVCVFVCVCMYSNHTVTHCYVSALIDHDGTKCNYLAAGFLSETHRSSNPAFNDFVGHIRKLCLQHIHPTHMYPDHVRNRWLVAAALLGFPTCPCYERRRTNCSSECRKNEVSFLCFPLAPVFNKSAVESITLFGQLPWVD